MKLWLLTLDDKLGGWDRNCGFVIRAETAYDARRIANENKADEGPVWMDPTAVTCEELTAEGEPGVVLADFHAG